MFFQKKRVKHLQRDNVLAILRQHKTDLCDRYGLISLGIFGSVARDEASENSDLDVIVKLSKPNLFALVHLREELISLLGCEVDIIHESQALRPFFRNIIERDSIWV
jgi:predicted nucleotidyltransferase